LEKIPEATQSQRRPANGKNTRLKHKRKSHDQVGPSLPGASVGEGSAEELRAASSGRVAVQDGPQSPELATPPGQAANSYRPDSRVQMPAGPL
jgi:hypothetical protein